MKGRQNNHDIFVKGYLPPLSATFIPKKNTHPEKVCRICGKKCNWQDPLTKDWYHKKCHKTIHVITTEEAIADIMKPRERLAFGSYK